MSGLIIFGVILVAIVARALLQIARLKESVSQLQQKIIDQSYNTEQAWQNTSQKINRIVKEIGASGKVLDSHCVVYENIDKKLHVHTPHINLLTLAREDNIPISSGCYGEATCGQCAFIPVAGSENLSPKTEKESNTLEMYGYPAEARLSCQCKVKGDVKVKLLNPLMSLSSWSSGD